MASIDLHPSELAYAFSYAKVTNIIGWGMDPFLPSMPEDGNPADWLSAGEARMVAAGRLTGSPDAGLNFTDAMTQAILSLVDPGIVLTAQRKAAGGIQTLTVHASGDRFIGLTRRTDGHFEMTRYAELTAAAAACASFVGAALASPATQAQIEIDASALAEVKRLVKEDRTAEAAAVLVRCGATQADAASAALALDAPSAAGVVSVLYCRANVVEDAEAFSIVTSAQGESWNVFSPVGPDGPSFIERTSVARLAARISVGIAARLSAG